MTGSICGRGKRGDSWELKFDIGRDEKAGKRITQFHTFRGTKKEAKVKLAELVTAASQGSYVAKSSITVGEHVRARIDQWEALGKVSPKTAERYRELLSNQIAPHLGARPLQKLRPADIEQWHATLKTSGRRDGQGGLSARTIGHAHRLLSKALKEGMRHDLVVRNVATAEQPPRVEADEIVILGAGDVKTLVEKLRGRSMYPIAITALFTGMRRGELLALRWSDIELDAPEKHARVRQTVEETKSGLRLKVPKTRTSTRDVGLPEIVVEALRDHRRHQLVQRLALGLGKLPDDALLFPALDGSLRGPRAFSKEWSDVAAGIGIPQATFHSLRHTHASHLIDAGIDVVKISRRLGHASPAITLRVYAHLFRARDDKSSKAIDEAVASLLA